LLFLFLIKLKDICLKEKSRGLLGDFSTGISEMKDSNVMRDERGIYTQLSHNYFFPFVC
jgi:hypothetical protein